MATEGLWAQPRRALTIGLVMTITIIASEALSVITIMPVVARDLGGIRLYGWVFSAFMLASMVGIVGAGRQADRQGPAGPYIAGLVFFCAGLIVAGLAPSMPVLVVGRALQGLGAGAIPAVAYVAIGRSLPDDMRPRMFAVLSSAWVLPGLFGPAVSAEVARALSWRWVFLGLVPLVLLAGPLALPALLRLGRGQVAAAPTQTAAGSGGEHRLDDALRTAAGAGLLLAGLTAPNVVAALVLVGVGAGIGVPPLLRLLPPGTLAARLGLPATVLSRGLLTFSFFGCDAFVTLAVTSVRHRSPTVASLAVTGGSLTWAAGAWAQARLSERWEGRRLVRLGLLIVLLGIGGMAVALSSAVPVAVAIASWTLAGFGMGVAYPALSLMMLREAPAGRVGWAAASLNLSDVLGTALGVGFGGAAIAASASLGRSLAAGIAVAFGVAATGAAVGLAVTPRLPDRGSAPAKPP